MHIANDTFRLMFGDRLKNKYARRKFPRGMGHRHRAYASATAREAVAARLKQAERHIANGARPRTVAVRLGLTFEAVARLARSRAAGANK